MNGVTLGGVAVGLSGLTGTAFYWWHREGHKAAALVPYLVSMAYGMLAIITGAGALFLIAGVALWGANGLGDVSLVYGVGGTTGPAGTVHQMVINPGGRVVVIVLTVVIVCLAKWSRSLSWIKFAVGAVTGISLGMSAAVAGAAAVPLVSAVNAVGSLIA